jgi:putative two-component system response regulator
MYGTVLYIDFNKKADEPYEYLRSQGLDVSLVSDCNEAIEVMSHLVHDLIIIDQDKHHHNLARLKDLKLSHTTACVPIILISKNLHTDTNIKLEALRCGVNDFMGRPIKYEELDLKLQNYLAVGEIRRAVLAENEEMKMELAIKKSHIKSYKKDIKHVYAEVVRKLSLAAGYRDKETGDHTNRVALYSKCLAERAGMDSHFQDKIFFAAPMHDIGKIGIPDEILLKPGALNEDEWVIMKRHSEIGYAILRDPKDSTLAMAQDIALYHHEKFDGCGYPHALVGDAIPLSARIMAIADVYDALRSDRPYKKGFSHEKSYLIMTDGDERLAPKHFDPDLLNIFIQNNMLFNEIYEGDTNAN